MVKNKGIKRVYFFFLTTIFTKLNMNAEKQETPVWGEGRAHEPNDNASEVNEDNSNNSVWGSGREEEPVEADMSGGRRAPVARRGKKKTAASKKRVKKTGETRGQQALRMTGTRRSSRIAKLKRESRQVKAAAAPSKRRRRN